jgi:hypothetical protein
MEHTGVHVNNFTACGCKAREGSPTVSSRDKKSKNMHTEIKLIFGGRLLADEETVGACGLEDLCMLHVGCGVASDDPKSPQRRW